MKLFTPRKRKVTRIKQGPSHTLLKLSCGHTREFGRLKRPPAGHKIVCIVCTNKTLKPDFMRAIL